MTIIISKEGKTNKITPSNFDNEDRLQKFIHENPENLPSYSSEGETSLLTIAREFPTSHGPIDVLAINEMGDIYIIEAKLHKNETRRDVVAQVIDYGSAFWGDYKTFDAFEKKLREKNNKGFDDYVKDSTVFADLEGGDVESMKESIKKNLKDGDFKFVIVMDNVDSKLQENIIFLNQKSSFSIYAISFAYYKTEGLEIFIPSLFGKEAEKSSTDKRTTRKWDEQTFFADATDRLTIDQLQAIKRLYDFSKKTADEIGWGGGPQKGSFNPKFYNVCPRSLFTVKSSGRLVLNFHWMNDTEEMKKLRSKFKENVSKIRGINISADYEDKFVRISKTDWVPVVSEFIVAIQDLIKK